MDQQLLVLQHTLKEPKLHLEIEAVHEIAMHHYLTLRIEHEDRL
jgi:hypothetical protein